jgi:hypothetical protein
MTPHAQEPTPVHSNRIGLDGQRGAPGRAVCYASHTVGLDGSLFEKEQGGHTCSFEPHDFTFPQGTIFMTLLSKDYSL